MNDLGTIGLFLGLVMVAFGLAMLLFGRKLFWVYVAISGFMFGVVAGGMVAPQQLGGGGALVIGLIMGGLFAVLGIYLQKPMAAIAGFVLGGFVLSMLFVLLRIGGNPYMLMSYNFGGGENLAVFVIGGLLCALLIWVTFEWALIIISALTGGLFLAVVGGVMFQLPAMAIVLFWLVLVGLGIYVQSRMLAKPAPAAPMPPPVARPRP